MWPEASHGQVLTLDRRNVFVSVGLRVRLSVCLSLCACFTISCVSVSVSLSTREYLCLGVRVSMGLCDFGSVGQGLCVCLTVSLTVCGTIILCVYVTGELVYLLGFVFPYLCLRPTLCPCMQFG